LKSESRTLNNPFSIRYLNIADEEAKRLNILVQGAKKAWTEFRRAR
jgi:hypothetical protein